MDGIHDVRDAHDLDPKGVAPKDLALELVALLAQVQAPVLVAQREAYEYHDGNLYDTLD